MLLCRAKAQIAELQVQLAASAKNYFVSKPLSNDLRYDLIIDTGYQLLRTQVKYCNRKGRRKNTLSLILGKKRQNGYSKLEIDLLLVFCPIVNEVLAFRPLIFHNKKELSIHLKNEHSKYYYKKFLWDTNFADTVLPTF